jgi:hypothetical protein
MAWMKETSKFFSVLATVSGSVIFAGSLLLTVVFPQLHIAFAVAIGAVLAGPLIVLGLRIHPQATGEDGGARRFWPAGSEARGLVWGVVAFVTLAVCLLMPCSVVVLVWARLPPGDNWNVVGVRLLFFTSAYCGWSWWLGVCTSTIAPWFRGKVPDSFVNSFSRKEVPVEPATIKDAAAKDWQLAVIALVTFLIATGAINLNGFGLQPVARPGQVRTIVAAVMWCQAHPNTTRATAVLVAVAASITFLYRLHRAAEKSNENAGV